MAKALLFLPIFLGLILSLLFWNQTEQMEKPVQIPVLPPAQVSSDVVSEVIVHSPKPPSTTQGRRDIFDLPWEDPTKVNQAAPQKNEEIGLPAVTSISYMQGKPMAIIDGEPLGVGEYDTSSRYRILEIERDRVRVHRIQDDTYHWLRLTDQSGE